MDGRAAKNAARRSEKAGGVADCFERTRMQQCIDRREFVVALGCEGLFLAGSLVPGPAPRAGHDTDMRSEDESQRAAGPKLRLGREASASDLHELVCQAAKSKPSLASSNALLALCRTVGPPETNE